MTALTEVSPAPSARATAEPQARFADLVRSEWIKIRSLRSTPWTLLLLTLFVVASSAFAALADNHDRPTPLPAGQVNMGALHDAFAPAGYMTLMLVAGCMGAIAVVSEYSSGLIRTTTAAVPARGSVVLAKAVVLTVLWTAVGAVAACGSFWLSQAVLSEKNAGIPITHPAAFRALAASALLAPVCALIGLGLGVLIRHSAGSMVSAAFTLLMLPAFFTSNHRWSADLAHTLVENGWERLTVDWTPPSGFHGIYFATVTGSWVVYAVWPVAAVVLALLVVWRRDV
ncbi:ABC transporter permease [Streptacidiphilus sp. PAMC 29251]